MGEVKRRFQPGFEFSVFVISLKTLIMLQKSECLNTKNELWFLSDSKAIWKGVEK